MQYTYICKICGCTMIVSKRIGSEIAPRCELCGGETRRKFDPPNVHYRGGGFYSTDKALDE